MRRRILAFVREHDGTFGASVETYTMDPTIVFCARVVAGFLEGLDLLFKLSYFSMQCRGV